MQRICLTLYTLRKQVLVVLQKHSDYIKFDNHCYSMNYRSNALYVGAPLEARDLTVLDDPNQCQFKTIAAASNRSSTVAQVKKRDIFGHNRTSLKNLSGK